MGRVKEQSETVTMRIHRLQTGGSGGGKEQAMTVNSGRYETEANLEFCIFELPGLVQAFQNKTFICMTTVVDKDMVKEALRELIHEEPAIFKSMLKEVLSETQDSPDEEFDRLLKKNFERFDETFRALA